MGFFVNPSEELLKRAVNSKIYYVDKSMILHELNQLLNTEDFFVCVARPRRFGKMNTGKFGDYWTKTGSYDSIRTYISMNFEGIKDDVKTMIAGGRIDVEVDDFLKESLNNLPVCHFSIFQSLVFSRA